jgi:Uma2 family endonuclease
MQRPGFFGPPDWVLEILSPSTSWKDQTEKRNIYEKYGVQEYWVLNPDTLDLVMYHRDGESFGPPIGAKLDRTVSPGLFPEIRLVVD